MQNKQEQRQTIENKNTIENQNLVTEIHSSARGISVNPHIRLQIQENKNENLNTSQDDHAAHINQQAVNLNLQNQSNLNKSEPSSTKTSVYRKFFTNCCDLKGFLVNYQMSQTGQLTDPSLICIQQQNEINSATNNQKCQQQISLSTFFDCIDEHYRHTYLEISSRKMYCTEEGLSKNKPQTELFVSWKENYRKSQGKSSIYIFCFCELLFFIVIFVALVIFVKNVKEYDSGSYILYSLKLEYIPVFRFTLIAITIIFIVSVSIGTIQFVVKNDGDTRIIYPILSFTVLLVIQFRYMLLKRRFWLDLDNSAFKDARFKRKGFIEYILSNNFIYFNALERAAVQDIQNGNHEELSKMVSQGNIQGIQNILVNRSVTDTVNSQDYFKVYNLQQSEDDISLDETLEWKCIFYILSNEFRELITICVQLYLATVELTQEAIIKGNDHNLGCNSVNNKGQCTIKISLADYYSCLSSYIKSYFFNQLFHHQEGYCEKGGKLELNKERGELLELYNFEIDKIFILVKVLLWVVLLSTCFLMFYFLFQYVKERSGKYNSGQFLSFCLQIDQSIEFKKYARMLLAIYLVANFSIFVIIIVYQKGQGISSCIFSTFSVISEFRALIWNQKISQNIQHPAFLQATFYRGGPWWFVWIYSDKYFNYLELAAKADQDWQIEQKKNQQQQQCQLKDENKNLPKQENLYSQQQQQNEVNLLLENQKSNVNNSNNNNNQKSIFNIQSSQKQKGSKNMACNIRTIDENSVSHLDQHTKEQYKRFPHLSQYIVKGDIEKISKILLYQI